ncbi:MAG: hypothetical protein ACR2RB_17315 [Gammaproteobacteria bacterium]
MFTATSPRVIGGKADGFLLPHWKYLVWVIFGAAVFVIGAYLGEPDRIQDSAQIDQPVIDELYLVDFSELFDDTDPVYRYGVLKVTEVGARDIEFLVSKLAYNQLAGPRSDIEYSETNLRSYYESEPVRVDRGKLTQMRESGTARVVVGI